MNESLLYHANKVENWDLPKMRYKLQHWYLLTNNCNIGIYLQITQHFYLFCSISIQIAIGEEQDEDSKDGEEQQTDDEEQTDNEEQGDDEEQDNDEKQDNNEE